MNQDSKNKTRIIILSRVPSLLIFWKLHGIFFFVKNNYNVTHLDLSKLIDKGTDNLYKNQEKLSGCQIQTIESWKELDSFLSTNKTNTIYFDFITGFSEFNLSTEKIFRYIKKYRIKYYVLNDGEIPSFNYINKIGFVNKIFKIFQNPYKFINLIFSRISTILVRHDLIYPKPEKIFVVKNSPSLNSYKKRIKLDKDKIIYSNSRDYNYFIEFQNFIKKNQNESNKYCVFLDDGYPNHPDFKTLSLKLNKDYNYFNEICNYFDKVEKLYNIKVIICGHPKSIFDSNNHPFGKFLFVKGDTIRYVANCQFVIAHFSTSINFAILFNKKVNLIYTNQMKKNNSIYYPIIAFADALNIKPVNVNNTNFEKEDLNINNFNYSDYKLKYIYSEDCLNKSSWEIILNEIQKQKF